MVLMTLGRCGTRAVCVKVPERDGGPSLGSTSGTSQPGTGLLLVMRCSLFLRLPFSFSRSAMSASKLVTWGLPMLGLKRAAASPTQPTEIGNTPLLNACRVPSSFLIEST